MTVENSVFTAIGATAGGFAWGVWKRWRQSIHDRRRPLYENGQRKEIIAMLRRIETRAGQTEEAITYLERRISTMEANAEEDSRLRREILRKVRLLESKE